MIIEARNGVVSLQGSLETNHWPAIQATANLLLRAHPNGILIDASHITHCSEDGARTLLDAMEYIERHRARIVVCQVPDEVQETLRHVPGVRSRIAIAATCEQGRASLELATDIRRQMPGGQAIAADAKSVRPRLVMIPLTEDCFGLKETIGLALQMGSIDARAERDGGHRDGRNGRRIAPLLHFLYVLEVPRAISLNSPMIEEEARAKEVLDSAAAIAEQAGVISQSNVARSRDAGEEVAARAAELGVEILVLSMPPATSAIRERVEPMINTLLQRSRCEVVLKNWPA